MNNDLMTELEPATINALQQLVQMNIDSYEGFQYAADTIEDEHAKQLFYELANERHRNAELLGDYLKINEEFPVSRGSYAAAIYRIWQKIRHQYRSHDSRFVVTEARRGEEHLKAIYERQLKDIPGHPIKSILISQYSSLMRNLKALQTLEKHCDRICCH